jgi:hypothetical protein
MRNQRKLSETKTTCEFYKHELRGTFGDAIISMERIKQTSGHSSVNSLGSGGTVKLKSYNNPSISSNMPSQYLPQGHNLSVTPSVTKQVIFIELKQSPEHGKQTDSLEAHYAGSATNAKEEYKPENAIQFRQHLVYYHFYCIELLSNISYIQTLPGQKLII